MNRRDQAAAQQDWMVDVRRALHRQPEVGLELPDTHDTIASILHTLGLPAERHDDAGLTARISGTAPGARTVVLRADMDALPVHERSGVDFASERPDAMHACGHDLHMAMLLGAARAFTSHPPLHDVVLAFQPGEESDRGALKTLEHANLQLGADEASAFAIHVHATLPAHTVHVSREVFMAYGDWFRVAFSGPGGHAARPESTGNPIEAAARFVTEAARTVDELRRYEHVVATVTETRFGNSVNVIPAQGQLRGTIRSLSSAQRERVIAGLRTITADAARATRVRGEFHLIEGYPAVVNDSEYVDVMRPRLVELLGADRVIDMTEPSMVIEDFSYFLQRWPGAMVYLGAQVPGHESFNHADDVVYDEAVLSSGAAMFLEAGDGFASGPSLSASS